MIRRDLDPSTVDDLLEGGGEADDWAALVASPAAAEHWSEARTRREKVDAIASAVEGHPWLAERLLLVRRAARSTSPAAGAGLVVQVLPSELSLTLDMGGYGPRSMSLPWGRTELVSLRLGEVIHVDPMLARTVFYETTSASGRLPSAWRMEAGESPVLIVLVGATVPDLPAAMTTGPLAALVLVEAHPGKNGP